MGVNLFQYKTDESMCLSCLPFTAPPHQSHTGRRSTSRRRVAASVSWAWRPTLPTSHSADATSDGRCCNSLRRLAPSHFSGNFSSRIYYLPSTIYGLRHRHRYRLRLFIIAQSYKKSTNYARKYFTNFAQRLSKIVKDCQCRPLSAKDCQRLTSSSYLCNVLERGNHRVENPESTRWGTSSDTSPGRAGRMRKKTICN